MAGPIDVVICLHKAFRRDISGIDDAAYEAASGDGDLSLVVARLRFFSEMLRVHGEAEDEFMNPALDKVAPDVAKAYFLDHRELERMLEGLAQIAASTNPLNATVYANAGHGAVILSLARQGVKPDSLSKSCSSAPLNLSWLCRGI